MQILFYHYMINQNKQLMLNQFLEAQKATHARGDWVQVLKTNMKFIELNISDDEWRQMKKTKLKSILKLKIRNKSLQYLLRMRKNKGKEIEYNTLEMSHYLLPGDNRLTIEDNFFFIH